jgi:hypothetical protein
LNAITKLAKHPNQEKEHRCLSQQLRAYNAQLQSGSTTGYYCEDYRGLTDGIDFLRGTGVEAIQILLGDIE